MVLGWFWGCFLEVSGLFLGGFVVVLGGFGVVLGVVFGRFWGGFDDGRARFGIRFRGGFGEVFAFSRFYSRKLEVWYLTGI